MAVQTAVLLSADGIVTPSRTFRQALGALLRPAAGALQVASGVLAGPAGSMGDLTLLSDTVLRVDPFVAVVQGTHNTKQGQYLVPNDELVDLAIVGKDSSQFRRVAVAVTVDDSGEAGVASSPTTDRARLHLVSGTLAASNPPLPAAPANTLLLGELLVPSVASGQPVTLTPYNPRTTPRGGVLPVHAGSTTAPAYDGETRWHPTLGLQIGTGGAWRRAADTILGEGQATPGTVLAGSPAWSDLVTVTATTSGGLCSAKWTGAAFNGQSGADRTMDWRVVVDGAEVGAGYTVNLPIAGTPTRVRAAAPTSTPAAGSHTWILQARGSVASAVVVDAGLLTVTERRG